MAEHEKVWRRSLAQPLDASEIATLLGEHAGALELFASQWTQQPEDCVQEAFIKIASTAAPRNPAAWLYRVVRNEAINQSRSNRRRANHEKLAFMLAHAQSDSSNPGQAVDDLAIALDAIRTEDRELIVLRIWSQFTWDQIAELTGGSSSSAQRKYVAALKQLKGILEPCQKTTN